MCRPEAAPERIVIDVTELRSGESVRVRDLPPDDAYEIVTKPEATILRIMGKRAAEAGMIEEEAPEEEAAEPVEGEAAASEEGKSED